MVKYIPDLCQLVLLTKSGCCTTLMYTPFWKNSKPATHQPAQMDLPSLTKRTNVQH